MLLERQAPRGYVPLAAQPASWPGDCPGRELRLAKRWRRLVKNGIRFPSGNQPSERAAAANNKENANDRSSKKRIVSRRQPSFLALRHRMRRQIDVFDTLKNHAHPSCNHANHIAMR
jgi:hypothetical protein